MDNLTSQILSNDKLTMTEKVQMLQLLITPNTSSTQSQPIATLPSRKPREINVHTNQPHDHQGYDNLYPPRPSNPSLQTPVTPTHRPPADTSSLTNTLEVTNARLTQLATKINSMDIHQTRQPPNSQRINHGELFATIAKGPTPDSTVKSIHINVTSQPHFPILVSLLKDHINGITIPRFDTSGALPRTIATNDVHVLCCQHHTTQLRQILPKQNVFYVSTLNSQYDITSTKDANSASQVNTSSSVSNTGNTRQHSILEFIRTQSSPKTKSSTKPSETNEKTAPSTHGNQSSPNSMTTDNPTSLPPPPQSPGLHPRTELTHIIQSMNAKASATSALPDYATATDSLTSWSDHMDQADPLTTGINSSINVVSDCDSLTFLLECGLIYCRSINAKLPRSTMRGILDQTRNRNTITGYPLKFGQATFTLITMSQHRHEFNHTETGPDTHPPYLNAGMTHCTCPICPLRTWPSVDNVPKSESNATLLDNVLNYIDDQINTVTATSKDRTYAISLLRFNETHNIRLHSKFRKLCELVYLKHSNETRNPPNQ